MKKPKYADGWYLLKTPDGSGKVELRRGKVISVQKAFQWMLGRDFDVCFWGGGHHLDGTTVGKIT